MENNANLHRDTDGSSLCATIAGGMGDVTAVGVVKGAAEKCKNSEAPLSTLVNVSCNSSSADVSAPGDVGVTSAAGESGERELIGALRVREDEKDAEASGSWSGDQISNGMGHDSVLAAEDSEGGASKLVNNKTDGSSSPPAEGSTRPQLQILAAGESEATKLTKPTHLCPGNVITVKSGLSTTLSEGLPSGSDPDPSLGGESRSIDSLESFSNLNSCPSSDLNSEGLEDRGLALALQSEYGTDGTKTSCAKDRAAGQSIYHIKWIKWREENTPIITQNENGPCPLLAIMNVLLLAWKVRGTKTLFKLKTNM